MKPFAKSELKPLEAIGLILWSAFILILVFVLGKYILSNINYGCAPAQGKEICTSEKEGEL